MEDDKSSNSCNLLLGRPFLSTARTKIDVYDGTLTMEFDGEVIKFNVYDAMKFPNDVSSVCGIDVIEPLTEKVFYLNGEDKLKVVLCNDLNLDSLEKLEENFVIEEELHKVVLALETQDPKVSDGPVIYLPKCHHNFLPSILQAPKLKLRLLPQHLRYVFLGEGEILPVIISNKLKKKVCKKKKIMSNLFACLLLFLFFFFLFISFF